MSAERTTGDKSQCRAVCDDPRLALLPPVVQPPEEVRPGVERPIVASTHLPHRRRHAPRPTARRPDTGGLSGHRRLERVGVPADVRGVHGLAAGQDAQGRDGRVQGARLRDRLVHDDLVHAGAHARPDRHRLGVLRPFPRRLLLAPGRPAPVFRLPRGRRQVQPGGDLLEGHRRRSAPATPPTSSSSRPATTPSRTRPCPARSGSPRRRAPSTSSGPRSS